MMLTTILTIIVLAVIAFLALANTIFRKEWGHDIMGWHDCTSDGFDGASMTGTCRWCGAKCLMDSQGNWFEK